MKHHNGVKKINKVDGGKKKAKRQYHKKLRDTPPVPMSKNKLFDNASDWLDDEPWRKW